MPILRRITREQFAGFLDDFYQIPGQTIRLGQAFLNKFYPQTPHPELYYCDDLSHTVEYIEQHYVEKQ